MKRGSTMYPYKVFFGMTLYELFIVVGIICALIIFRLLSDREGVRAKLYNFVVFDGVAGVAVGFCCAIFAQAVYNYIENGIFTIDKGTGMTFYGGFIGGAAMFFAIYFAVGRVIFRDGYHKEKLPRILDMLAAGIAAAHGFGRIGCLMAGCCYGRPTEAWYGVWNEYLACRTVPVQLFEALFLFALSAFLVRRFVKGRRCGIAVYMVLYGVWRFFIEFFRSDDRGETVLSVFSPSQLTAIILVAVGAVILISFRMKSRKRRLTND